MGETVTEQLHIEVKAKVLLTCRACGVEPLAWLRHALTQLPQCAEDAHIEDLHPFNILKTATA